jgi:phospholipid/cholesterol/gamma-HCH transport system substrate-binding protein
VSLDELLQAAPEPAVPEPARPAPRIRRRGVARPLTYSILFVVVTVAATAILGLSIANTGVGATAAYHAVFADVTGLSVGDDVDIAGVRVGDVTSITVHGRDLADVGFEVQSDRQLPSSVTATLYYKNLIGQLYLELGQGAGQVGRLLRPGGTIPVARTTPALDLTELFNGFQPLFAALSPGEVNVLSTDIIELLQGEGPTLDSLIANIGTLATTLAHKSAVIDSVIKNLNSVVTTVNSRGSELATLVTSLQRLVSGLAADRKPFGAAISAMASLTNSTAGLLKGFNPPLQADIKNLTRLSANLVAGTPAIDSFLQTWPQKEADIGRLASYGSWFNLLECQATVTGVQEAFGPAPTGVPISPADKARCTA